MKYENTQIRHKCNLKIDTKLLKIISVSQNENQVVYWRCIIILHRFKPQTFWTRSQQFVVLKPDLQCLSTSNHWHNTYTKWGGRRNCNFNSFHTCKNENQSKQMLVSFGIREIFRKSHWVNWLEIHLWKLIFTFLTVLARFRKYLGKNFSKTSLRILFAIALNMICDVCVCANISRFRSKKSLTTSNQIIMINSNPNLQDKLFEGIDWNVDYSNTECFIKQSPQASHTIIGKSFNWHLTNWMSSKSLICLKKYIHYSFIQNSEGRFEFEITNTIYFECKPKICISKRKKQFHHNVFIFDRNASIRNVMDQKNNNDSQRWFLENISFFGIQTKSGKRETK